MCTKAHRSRSMCELLDHVAMFVSGRADIASTLDAEQGTDLETARELMAKVPRCRDQWRRLSRERWRGL